MAAIARGIHLYPFRTQKLSLLTPMVLGRRRSGRVGSCQFKQAAGASAPAVFFCPGPGRRTGCPESLGCALRKPGKKPRLRFARFRARPEAEKACQKGAVAVCHEKVGDLPGSGPGQGLKIPGKLPHSIAAPDKISSPLANSSKG